MLLKKVDRTLAVIHGKLKIGILQPINVPDEKKKVFEDNCYNPKFSYNPNKKDYDKIEKLLLSLKPIDGVYGKLLKEKINELYNLSQMLKNIGKKDFTTYSIKRYGRPSQELVKEAYRILKKDEEEVWKKYSRLSMTKRFMDQFNINNLNWKVEEKEMVAGAAFNTKNKKLYINKNHNYNENDVKRLIIHEIGTHIIRAENGKRQGYKMFEFGFPKYLDTEEGFAAYNEFKCGLLSPKIFRNYAGRVIANNLSINNSFSRVYNHLLEYFPRQDAWNLSLRSKRGLTNTSLPGAFTKDHLYLKGFLKVKEFAENGGDMKKLYIGKIGVEHIPLLKYL